MQIGSHSHHKQSPESFQIHKFNSNALFDVVYQTKLQLKLKLQLHVHLIGLTSQLTKLEINYFVISSKKSHNQAMDKGTGFTFLQFQVVSHSVVTLFHAVCSSLLQ